MVDPKEVTAHDEVTRTIIIGMLARLFSESATPREYVEGAQEIMDMIKRRGYEPQIRSLNQLKNGKRI